MHILNEQNEKGKIKYAIIDEVITAHIAHFTHSQVLATCISFTICYVPIVVENSKWEAKNEENRR